MEREWLIQTVTKVQAGDKDALQELYMDSRMRVYALALRILKDVNDAEDITQEVFIKVQRKISTLREPAAYYRWLFRITDSKCIDFLRQRKEFSGFDEKFGTDEKLDIDHPAMPEKAFKALELQQIFLAIIEKLHAGQRECVKYYYYEQFSVLEIAEILQISENTVKSRLSLARAKIKAALEKKELDDGIKLW